MVEAIASLRCFLCTRSGRRGRQLTGGVHACRYGCSKWASEVQLQQLHERYGVPVSIFRCGMILAHSRCACVLCRWLIVCNCLRAS